MLHLSEPVPVMDKGTADRIHNPLNQEFSFLLVVNLHFLVSWHSGKVAEELRIPLFPQRENLGDWFILIRDLYQFRCNLPIEEGE
jgi:hypothetical protein